MKASFARHIVVLSFFASATALTAFSAQAQNYVDARNFSSPNVMVDLTVLDNPNAPTYAELNSQDRTLPPPSMRRSGDIRTPQGVISRTINEGGMQEFHEETTQPAEPDTAPVALTQQPIENTVVLKQDIEAIPSPGAPVKKAAPTEDTTVVQITEEEPKEDAVAIKTEAPTPAPVIEQPAKEEIKVASVAPKTEPKTMAVSQKSVISIAFMPDNSELTTAEENKLQDVVSAIESDVSKRVQIKAFASGTPETANKARRLSLTRALNARTYLLKQGIKPTQIDVRALGLGNTIDKPSQDGIGSDRVDVIFLN